MTLLDQLKKKVKGERIFARDYRARDMKGWPEKTLHACLLRAVHVDRVFTGLDRELLDRLAPGVQVVTAVELRTDDLSNPDREHSNFGRMLVERGERAEMHGQPVALLIFARARDLARFLESDQSSRVIRYGEPGASAPPPTKGYARSELVQYAGVKGPKAPELRDRIEREIAQGGDGSGEKWICLDRTFQTPSADPMFLEPEAGIAWWERAGPRLHLVLGTQSPAKDVENVKELWPSSEREALQVVLTPCPPGGAFGGRDESSFPLYLALAARYAAGPVRLAFSRAEQFASGIKRHASVVRNRLAYTASGALKALRSEVSMDGGGQRNLTGPVLSLAVLHAAGPYRFPRTALTGTAYVSSSAPAGSMRGFGIPQVAFPLECMIDEIAAELGQCPVKYRQGRMLQAGDLDVAGMKLDHDLGNQRLCNRVLTQRLWKERDRDKRRRDRKGEIAYGVGFACCMEAYGTTTDAGFGGVEVSSDGALSVCSSAVDMGQGAAQALAIATAKVLGSEAKEVTLGDLALFEKCLPLVSKKDPEKKDATPWYTPKVSNSMSASMTAFFHLHTVEEACRIVFEHGLLPAARRLCPRVPATAAWTWKGGRLVAKGFPRGLTLGELAAEAHRGRGVVGARAHAVFRHHFVSAWFKDLDTGGLRRPIDWLAVRRGSDDYEVEARVDPTYKDVETSTHRRTLYASVGHVLAVEVYLRSGRIQVVEAVTVLDAGAVHHRELLAGQAEGGLAMGLGMALTEELPASAKPDEEWTLNRYQIPRISHMPPRERMHLVLVEPGPEGGAPRRKGIAEAAMTTVAPALANAVAHATGLRLRQVPFTADRVRAALASR